MKKQTTKKQNNQDVPTKCPMTPQRYAKPKQQKQGRRKRKNNNDDTMLNRKADTL